MNTTAKPSARSTVTGNRETPIVDDALAFAARAHGTQLRKGTDIPYIAHPAAVAVILAGAGCEDHVVAAGALHDIVEDTDCDLVQIERTFGERVARLVEACTESRGSWEDRKRHTVQALETGVDPNVAMVMCADKLHNARVTLAEWRVDGDAVWERLKRGKEGLRWYVHSLAKAFARYDGELFREYQAVAEQLFPSFGDEEGVSEIVDVSV